MLFPLQVIGSLLEPQAEIQVEDSCVQFEVQVRCRRLNGTGYWSDWSKSHTSIVYNRKGKAIYFSYATIIILCNTKALIFS